MNHDPSPSWRRSRCSYAAYGINASCWHLVVSDRGIAARWRFDVQAWCASIVWKYVPGKVWQGASRWHAYHRARYPLRPYLEAFALEQFLTLAAAVVFALGFAITLGNQFGAAAIAASLTVVASVIGATLVVAQSASGGSRHRQRRDAVAPFLSSDCRMARVADPVPAVARVWPVSPGRGSFRHRRSPLARAMHRRVGRGRARGNIGVLRAVGNRRARGRARVAAVGLSTREARRSRWRSRAGSGSPAAKSPLPWRHTGGPIVVDRGAGRMSKPLHDRTTLAAYGWLHDPDSRARRARRIVTILRECGVDDLGNADALDVGCSAACWCCRWQSPRRRASAAPTPRSCAHSVRRRRRSRNSWCWPRWRARSPQAAPRASAGCSPIACSISGFGQSAAVAPRHRRRCCGRRAGRLAWHAQRAAPVPDRGDPAAHVEARNEGPPHNSDERNPAGSNLRVRLRRCRCGGGTTGRAWARE